MRATPEQAPILANLLELYCYDFSELIDLELGPDGRFGYEPLPLYWTEQGRHPLLVAIDGQWAGSRWCSPCQLFLATGIYGTWRSFSLCVGGAGVGWERQPRTQCGGASPVCGKCG